MLFGGDTMTALLAGGIAAAPPAAAPLEAVACALDAAGREAFIPARRQFAVRRRGVPDMTACVAAELGALALKIAYERWTDAADGGEFSEVARRTLSELLAASARC